jgi:hypothetical protein
VLAVLLSSEPGLDRAGDLGVLDDVGVVEAGELEQFAAIVVDDIAAGLVG